MITGVADSFRRPEDQVTGWLYVRAVYFYQWAGRPMLKGRVQCRFHPTCSEYSIGAVEVHGIRWGLFLTFQRLASCTPEAPIGAEDPVPPAD
ncbi:MAG: membrane protein insertion efficiency factor YidD [Planctomycetes bacterium]|nr:membrane protein insertion efficiency factor YidD [Planctomycetota bacterium]